MKKDVNPKLFGLPWCLCVLVVKIGLDLDFIRRCISRYANKKKVSGHHFPLCEGLKKEIDLCLLFSDVLPDMNLIDLGGVTQCRLENDEILCTLMVHNWRELMLKFISVRDFREKSGQVWKDLAKEGDLILTNNGKPMALLSSLKDADVENSVAAVRRARAVAAVERMQTASVEAGLDKLSLKDINRIIDKTRKGRSR